MNKNEILKLVGSTIKERRKNNGLTQEELAERSELSIETISSVERGVLSTTIYTAYQISRALDIDLSYLLDFSDNQAKLQTKEVKEILQKIAPEHRQQVIEALSIIIKSSKGN